MKSSLLLIGLLFFAAAAQAQHAHASGMNGSNNTSLANSGGWGSSSGLGNGTGPIGRPVAYADRRSFSIIYARNDEPFVPSTYMSYEEAVNLGRQLLEASEKAAHGEGAPSLGEVARSYRIVKVPTFRLRSRALQDNAGKLEVCNLNGNACHQP